MDNTQLSGLILTFPILSARFLLTAFLGKDTLRRAAFSPPTKGVEKIAYWVNILTTFALFIISFFLKIRLNGLLNISGLFLFILALVLYIASIIQFAKPNNFGLNMTGLYSISRNPMYIAFFLYFLACSMLTDSWILLIVLLIFQISVHFLIISEERWCKKQFGETYLDYLSKVRRYI